MSFGHFVAVLVRGARDAVFGCLAEFHVFDARFGGIQSAADDEDIGMRSCPICRMREATGETFL
jgi:hypothetical protein